MKLHSLAQIVLRRAELTLFNYQINRANVELAETLHQVLFLYVIFHTN